MKYRYFLNLKAIIIVSVFLFNAILSAQEMKDYNRQVFPLDHALNTPIDQLPVHPNSAIYINAIGSNKRLHPDFGDSWDDEGTIRPMGIPYNVVGSGQPLRQITWVNWGDESDPGPWPIPSDPYIEGVFDWQVYTDGDRHMLILDSVANILYESGNVYGNAAGTEWEGGCGAVFNLNNYTLRTDTWTSADAAGLPIFPLLIRYDEVEKALNSDGYFHHAIRFTTDTTRKEYIWPARHYASKHTDAKWPPMGLRLRLKADYDISGFSPRMQVILRSMKKYGLIIADNGSDWFFQGTHDSRWDGDEIEELKSVRGSDFEVVDITQWMQRDGFDINSAAVPPGIDTKINNPETTSGLELFQNYPNPFSIVTTIRFEVPETGFYSLKIFDYSGKEITTLINRTLTTGENFVEWDGTNSSKKPVSSGVYYCQLNSNSGNVVTGKIILMK